MNTRTMRRPSRTERARRKGQNSGCAAAQVPAASAASEDSRYHQLRRRDSAEYGLVASIKSLSLRTDSSKRTPFLLARRIIDVSSEGSSRRSALDAPGLTHYTGRP